jgi:hypothetical protein
VPKNTAQKNGKKEASYVDIKWLGKTFKASLALMSFSGWVHSASWVQLRSYLKDKNIGSGVEIREYGSRGPSRCPHGTLYPQRLALTSPKRGVRSVGIVRSLTQDRVCFFCFFVSQWYLA